jgi:hypothetical protein
VKEADKTSEESLSQWIQLQPTICREDANNDEEADVS